METDPVRARLDALIRARGVSYAALSGLLGRNPAYVQQFIKRGSPRKLDEADRRLLAEFFGVAEADLGGPGTKAAPDRLGEHAAPTLRRAAPALRPVPRLAVEASAGPGRLAGDERQRSGLAVEESWLRALGVGNAPVSMIRVEGDSMAPALQNGDEILVAMGPIDQAQPREGIYVLRLDDALLVKRLAFRPDGRLSISSDNPLYPSFPDVDPASVAIIGRVVWVGRRV